MAVPNVVEYTRTTLGIIRATTQNVGRSVPNFGQLQMPFIYHSLTTTLHFAMARIVRNLYLRYPTRLARLRFTFKFVCLFIKES